MKNSIKKTALFFMLILCSIKLKAADLTQMAFIEIDARTSKINSFEYPLNSLVRVELEKSKKYQLLDKYDIEYLVGRDSLQVKNCYSRLCLSSLGKKLKVEKMFTGTIETLANKIIITYKILDVESGNFEKVQVNEFLNLPQEIRNMISITMNDMFSLPNDVELVNSLTKKNVFDNTINNPYKPLLKTDGPRMGFTYFTGHGAELLGNKKSVGGFDAHPMMFQFGYQFEKQYLNEGNFQALVEFVPMLTGLDQGLCIPSFTLLNGMRNNKNGWEFAFGPSVSFVKKANGFYDQSNVWRLAKDTANIGYKPILEKRIDSRGDVSIMPSFVFAFGKTFKSGRMNIPVNAYVVPSKEGIRFGVSFGFNARDRFIVNKED